MNNIDTSKIVVLVYLCLYSTNNKLPDSIVFKKKKERNSSRIIARLNIYMVPTATFFFFFIIISQIHLAFFL